MYPLTLHHLLWRMQTVHPTSEVVTISGEGENSEIKRCSYEQLVWRAESLAHGLREEIGLTAGETVSVLGWNDQHHFEVLLAVPLVGAKVNSVNLRLGRSTLAQLVGNPLPKAVVVDSKLFDHPAVGADIAAVVSELRGKGVTIISIDGPAIPSADSKTVSYERLIDLNLGRRWEESLQNENLPAFIFHTSGTTGHPKSYDITHRMAMLHCLSQATVDATGLSYRDRVMPLAPFFHVNGWGLPLTCALTGASLILVGGDLHPRRIANIMQTERVTVAAAVPTVWYDICAAVDRGEADRPLALREVVTGGSRLPQSLWKSIETILGAKVASAWGMTETMACSTYERERPHQRAGKPIPLIELKLDAREEDHANAEGDPGGRLNVRGPFVAANNGAPQGTWFRTGDLATIDVDGSLTLRDREHDLIKSGGEWIAPAEIEQHLCTHPDVIAAVVVPVKHAKWIERPLAYVILSQNHQMGNEAKAALLQHISQGFPRWWIPDNVIVVDELPTTAMGKIDKRLLQRMANSEQEKV